MKKIAYNKSAVKPWLDDFVLNLNFNIFVYNGTDDYLD